MNRKQIDTHIEDFDSSNGKLINSCLCMFVYVWRIDALVEKEKRIEMEKVE